MRRREWSQVAFSDRMATVEFRVAERAHIVVDSAVCESCSTRVCVSACPANLFAPTSDGGILFNYEDCFECGTCYLLCNAEGAISWSYPEGGFRRGVSEELMDVLVCLRPDAGPADWAALEAGLAVPGGRVTVATVGLGPLPESSEPSVLKLALTVGAARSVYLSVPGEHDPRSEPDARGVAEALLDMAAEVDLVVCGHDVAGHSAGAIPAFLSALLGRPQVLGALELEASEAGVRSLCLADDGRRAEYSCDLPAVVSVVPGSVRLRRAPLANVAGEPARVEVVSIEGRIESRPERLGDGSVRTKVVAPPASGDPIGRILALTLATSERTPARVVECDPAEAARLTVEALSDWGYL